MVSSPEPRAPALRWSLGLWCLAAALLLWLAPPPPPPPVTSAEDEAIFQRTVDQTVEKTRRWQQERGDQTLEWDEARGHLAVVIEGVGGELHLFEQLHALRFPLTFSVVPDAVYAAGAQLRLRADRRRPREILLHLPEGAEGRSLSPRDVLVAALQRVPGAVGVDVHTGSLATASWAAIDACKPVLQARGLYVLDASTTPPSPTQAGELPVLRADLFLDADPSPAAVLAQLERAAERAQVQPLVVIAHPSPAVVETLREGLPRLHARGIGVYPLRELLAHQAERDRK